MFYGVSVHNHVHIKRIILKRDLTKAPTFIALSPIKTLLDSIAVQHHHPSMPVKKEGAVLEDREHLLCTLYLHSIYKKGEKMPS